MHFNREAQKQNQRILLKLNHQSATFSGIQRTYYVKAGVTIDHGHSKHKTQTNTNDGNGVLFHLKDPYKKKSCCSILFVDNKVAL